MNLFITFLRCIFFCGGVLLAILSIMAFTNYESLKLSKDGYTTSGIALIVSSIIFFVLFAGATYWERKSSEEQNNQELIKNKSNNSIDDSIIINNNHNIDLKLIEKREGSFTSSEEVK